MTSRFLAGAALLAAVGLAIGGTAAAQRIGRLQQVMERAKALRGNHVADPNMSPISGPGDYRFSFVHDGMTREYLTRPFLHHFR